MGTITTIKGFDHELKCRGFQYEVGKTYTTEGSIELCGNGFHAIRDDVNPLSVFQFYEPSRSGKPSRYCIVECGGEIEHDEIKICCSQIKIIKEISIDEIHKKAQEWVNSQCDNTENGGNCSSLRGGDGSSLKGGDRSALNGGEGSSLTGGDCSSLTGGDGSSLTGGNRSSLRGGYGSSLRGGYGSSLTGGYGSSLTGGDGSSLRGGNRSSLTGCDCSSLRGGDGSSLRSGDGSSLKGGDGSSLRGGNRSSLTGCDGSKFCGGKWSAFFVEITDEDGDIIGIATAVVDDLNVKANQWYEFKNGEWTECSAPDNAID